MSLFLRAFLQVGLVAANTRLIAAQAYPAAFGTSFALSWVWWSNVGSAGDDRSTRARVVYCLGAACGTVVGTAVASMWR